MGLFFDAVLSLLLLGLTAAQGSSAHGGNTSSLPSATTLAGCRRSCGNLTFDYPFGISPRRCFRDSGFELICNETTETPRLFLGDGITEIIGDIDTTSEDIIPHFKFSFSYSIPMVSGVNVYNKSWVAPGRHLTLDDAVWNITGCDFDVYQVLDHDTNLVLLCSVTCPNKEITETVARQDCNGTGCCSISVFQTNAIELRFSRKQKGQLDEGTHTNPSSMWDSINVTTVYTFMTWTIIDEPTCASTFVNGTNYACVSNNSQCFDNPLTNSHGYNCFCADGYEGNPYLVDGCKRDKGYTPFQQKSNCSQTCGNISIPFPFGLEEGCAARKLFLLNCTNTSTSSLQLNDDYLVTYINVSDGLVGVEDVSYLKQQMYRIRVPTEPELYVGSGESASVQWAVANLTCQEAQQNMSGYACVSINSTCLAVNSNSGYTGYRCKCTSGFEGNPYIQNGCTDINECKTLGTCKGVCHNTIGSFYCTECPDKTQYDMIAMQCTPTKKQNLLLGILIGLSGGFSLLLLGLSATFFIRKWKRDIQKQLRRKHFRKNQGLLSIIR